MLLKALEIQGFKSFPDKTRLEYSQGLTAIVGPNGSGKSNISDAVRWVMGEQSTKTLRGAKMEDVIFIGTKSRKSQGVAQVSLTFDNTDRSLGVDSDEVTVTRKYYRSGESEYLINKAPVRLKDINELFMDTGLGKDGYSLVGQGKIAEIISAKSTERREIFEEAAGISKLRYRKQESERRLQMAEENLVRLRDILSELEGRVEPLRIQSEKAEKFLQLSADKKRTELSLWLCSLDRLRQMLRSQEDKIIVSTQVKEQIQEEIDAVEEEIRQTYQQMQNCDIETDTFTREREQLDQQTAEGRSQIAVYQNDIEHHEENIGRAEEELSTYQRSHQEMEADIVAKREQEQAIAADIQQIREQIAKEEAELLQLRGQGDDTRRQADQLTAELNELTLHRSQYQMLIASAQNHMEELKNRQAVFEQNRAERQTAFEQAGKELAELKEAESLAEETRLSLQNTRKGYQLKLESRHQKLQTAQAACNQLDTEMKEKKQHARILQDLENNMEGFSQSVKTVSAAAKQGILHGILGTVAQILTVEPAYSVAIETALGAGMQNLVTENEQHAKAAIRLLKERNAGRATFLPLTSIDGKELVQAGLEESEGFIALASRLVSFDPRYQGVIASLLGRTAVCEDLDTAVSIARKFGYRFKVVTLDGQVIHAGGSLTGGSQNRNAGVLSRRGEIAALQDQIKILETKQQQALDTVAEIAAQEAKLQAEIRAVDSEILTCSEDKIRFESERKRLEQTRQDAEKALLALEQEQKNASERVSQSLRNAEEVQEKLHQTEELLAQKNIAYEAIRQSQDTLAEQRKELSDRLQAYQMDLIGKEKDLQNLSAQIEEMGRRRDDSQNTVKSIQEHKEKLQQDITEIRLKISHLEQEMLQQGDQATALRHRIESLRTKRQELEAATTQMRQKEKELSAQREKHVGELVRLEERRTVVQSEYDAIISRMWEDYQMTRSEAQSFASPATDESAAKRELGLLKAKIKELGNINVDAIEEYKEVSERYRFLNGQIADAEKSKQEITRLIQDLTGNMQRLFSENFEKINRHFGQIFTELFGGGRASLYLSDPEHVLESGIEISVEPPGKIIRNLMSLSGGEQAFVAIAIYFAILKVRPAPFCILDEIEAALDDVNVVKYARYLRTLSEKTQFIAITHRRGTMEEADVLYGVTMQEEGVSKLLELKVNEAEQRLGLHTE